MILIFSKTSDISTQNILQRIPANIPVRVIYVDDVFEFPKFKFFFDSKNSPTLYVDDLEVTVVWFRKAFRVEYLRKVNAFTSINNTSEKRFLKKEWIKIYQNFSSLIKYCPKTKIFGGSKYSSFTDAVKLEIMWLARIAGLEIPKVYFMNYLPDENKTNLVTKPVGEFSFLEYENSESYGLYTSRLKNVESSFGPSLFQEEIKKKADIRVCFIDGNFFTGSIFQSSEDQLDYRIYDKESMPVWLRFQLSEEIKHKISKLMKDINANFGIIDFVMNEEETLFFLEVNLGGQFGDLSYNCDYDLENTISQKLISFYEK